MNFWLAATTEEKAANCYCFEGKGEEEREGKRGDYQSVPSPVRLPMSPKGEGEEEGGREGGEKEEESEKRRMG